RAAIGDLLADYYAGFGAGGEHDFSAFFTVDGVLDVNCMVATGAEQIRAMYTRAAGAPPPARPADAPPPGRSVMVLSNLSIQVEGDRATSNSLFTALHTDALTGQPWVNEYGREHNEYVKRDGRWQISRRTVTTDAGMPASLLPGYIQR
ncbi:MAG: nuclear transport factor 2 family protein, partial [Gammaproteobacteria bacterium]|nr:nuclear transport factor 2 family protein [Gammaproteobacteria bacterium]